jgi:hypothetical protein
VRRMRAAPSLLSVLVTSNPFSDCGSTHPRQRADHARASNLAHRCGTAHRPRGIRASVRWHRGTARSHGAALVAALCEPGEPVRYAVELHLLISEAEMQMWQGVAARCRLHVDDVVHLAALAGLQAQLAHDGDPVGADAGEAGAWELRARHGRLARSCGAKR